MRCKRDPARPLLAGAALLLAIAGAFAQQPAYKVKRLKVGKPFPDFKDTEYFTDKPIALSDFRGKVVLVDFWATWCGPCLRELPNVQKAYEKYHDKGLEIISISLDRDLNRFERFVKQRDLSWHHICDGKFWDARLAREYGIRGIPAMFLVGRDGTLVGANLRGPALHQAIEQALRQPGPQDAESDHAQRADGDGDAEAATTSQPAPLTPDDVERAKRWLSIADGMRANRNVRLARKYYRKVVEGYPNTDYARAARAQLDALPGND
jgi:thiol-disulfide isomerase/thioredoxin